MKVGVALLYGLYNSDNAGYQGYLNFISQKIKTEKLDKIVLCGGFTDPNRPEESESSTAEKYLRKVTEDFEGYVLENSSITTNQNLEFASKKLAPEDEVVVFCDLIRLAKVIWISQYFLLKESQENIYKSIVEFTQKKDLTKPFLKKNLTVMAYDFPNRTKEVTIQQSFAALIDVFALYNENFNEMNIKQRKMDFGLS